MTGFSVLQKLLSFVTAFSVYFEVEGNKLEGSIPSELFSLPVIRRLNFQDNTQLEGTIPANVSTTLRSLRLGGTRMGGPLRDSLFDVIGMTELNLERASFNGTLSESFANFRDIAILQLNNNSFTGIIPTAFDQLDHLSK